MTVREFLTEYNKKDGYGTDDDELIETLIEYGNIVHREGRDIHRWYMCDTVVTEIDGTYIKYIDYTITGDSCMRDMDLKYDLDSAKIVERKEREIVEIYYE